MRKILSRFLLASTVAAAVWACGADSSSSDGSGGSGGSGGNGGTETEGPLGSCSNPIDFNEVEIWDNEQNEFVSGNLEEGEANHAGSCGGNRGKELVYKWTAPTDGVITFIGLQSGADVVVYASPVCGSPDDEIACVSKPGPDSGEPAGVMKKGESIYLVADSRKDTATEFQIKLTFSPALKDGDPCRTDGLTGVCELGWVCNGVTGFCGKNTPPRFSTPAPKVQRTASDAILVDFAGEDDEGNAMFILFQFLDANGDVLPVDDEGGTVMAVDLENDLYGKAKFTSSLGSDADFFKTIPAKTVRMALVDYDKLYEDILDQSAEVEVDVQPATP